MYFIYLGHLHGDLDGLGKLPRGGSKIADLAGSFRLVPILVVVGERRGKDVEG